MTPDDLGGAQARDRVKLFSGQECARRTREVYRKVLQE